MMAQIRAWNDIRRPDWSYNVTNPIVVTVRVFFTVVCQIVYNPQWKSHSILWTSRYNTVHHQIILCDNPEDCIMNFHWHLCVYLFNNAVSNSDYIVRNFVWWIINWKLWMVASITATDYYSIIIWVSFCAYTSGFWREVLRGGWSWTSLAYTVAEVEHLWLTRWLKLNISGIHGGRSWTSLAYTVAEVEHLWLTRWPKLNISGLHGGWSWTSRAISRVNWLKMIAVSGIVSVPIVRNWVTSSWTDWYCSGNNTLSWRQELIRCLMWDERWFTSCI
jgi:hypothetical protein